MEKELKMPKLSPKSDDYFFGSWEKQVGDEVKKGDILFEVESEKVISEVPSDYNGVLKEQRVEEGNPISAGDVVAVLEVSDS
ncbi:biotin-requiring enzyme [Lactobacillus alvi]|uniref:Biotin-requiring enzyme n=1 Tax=Limosilactobacillus alvi TaxID=990412 RepID=A0ABS2EQR1_9LACO|nr:lipoyl domain-containing protein [Limosilactobacillus alvi]MBM6754401.1 biotin-requiring enzyme [Limosilactobacillus alvi]